MLRYCFFSLDWLSAGFDSVVADGALVLDAPVPDEPVAEGLEPEVPPAELLSDFDAPAEAPAPELELSDFDAPALVELSEDLDAPALELSEDLEPLALAPLLAEPLTPSALSVS